MILRELYNRLLSPDRDFVKNIRGICGFTPRKVWLYRLALTHSSYAKSKNPETTASRYCNERLEFLGDSILDAVVAEHLFKIYPYKDEGFLTEMRSKIVNRKSLNKISQDLNLAQLIVHNQGGSHNEAMYGDALEAIVGAIFLDLGYEKAKRFILKIVLEENILLDEKESELFSPKNKLLEYIQREKLGKLVFEVMAETGDGASKRFRIRACIGEEEVGVGEGRNKKTAEQNAATDALSRLNLLETP